MMDFNRLRELFKDNTDALNLAADVTVMVRIWDDLIDRDQPVSDEKINQAFYIALISIPSNPFYRAYYPILSPLVRSTIQAWMTGNKLERGSNPHGHEVAHILRYFGAAIFVEFLHILGGPAWADEHAPEIWLMLKEESYADYQKELNHAPISP